MLIDPDFERDFGYPNQWRVVVGDSKAERSWRNGFVTVKLP
jgi:hypothetical protein